MEGVIYKYTNRINGKVYIGQTIDEVRRINNHKKLYGDSLFHRALKKYGFDSFDYEVIERVDESQLDEQEIFWISYYKSNDRTFGYNLTTGGDGLRGYRYTEEQRKRRSEQSKGNKSFTGHTHTEVYKQKMSDLFKGKTLSDETKKKIGDANKGNKHRLGSHLSEETKKKISEAHKGIVTRGSKGMSWKLIDGKRVYYDNKIK